MKKNEKSISENMGMFDIEESKENLKKLSSIKTKK